MVNSNNNSINLVGTYYTYAITGHVLAIYSDKNVLNSRNSILYFIPFRPMIFCRDHSAGDGYSGSGLLSFYCVKFFLDPLY